jgi:hypothetical protein
VIVFLFRFIDPGGMMEVVKSLHYSAHALEQLKQSALTIRKDMPGIRNAFRTVVSLLEESVKFILPDHADLIDMEDLAVSRNKCNSQLIFLSMLITKLGILASETSLPLGV